MTLPHLREVLPRCPACGGHGDQLRHVTEDDTSFWLLTFECLGAISWDEGDRADSNRWCAYSGCINGMHQALEQQKTKGSE